MTDRELLEAAAKAAGVFLTPKTLKEVFPKWKWCDEFEPYHLEDGGMVGTVVVYSYSGELSGTTSQEWNPLTDDGDALRLAVKLEMRVDIFARTSSATITTNTDRHWVEEPHSLELMADAATRRAIVRAAAEMGK